MRRNYLAGLVDGLDMGNNTKVETLLFDKFQKKNMYFMVSFYIMSSFHSPIC